MSDAGMETRPSEAMQARKAIVDPAQLPVHEALVTHERALAGQGEALSMLDNVIAELVDRLGPVMGPTEPTPPMSGDTTTVGPDRRVQSPLFDRVDELTHQLAERTDNVERLSRRVRDTINRLEV